MLTRQVFLKKGKVQTDLVSAPLISSRNVLIRVHYSFISSGTEGATIAASGKGLLAKYVSHVAQNTQKMVDAVKEHGITGTMALLKEKNNKLMPLGYSCSGQVIAVGADVEKFSVGDFVACAGSTSAYHSDIVCVPQNLIVRVRRQENLKSASLCAIGAIALQAVRRSQIQLGESVCVIGLGLIGQIIVQLLKKSGCTVIGVDVQQERLDLAKKSGADYVFNPLGCDVVKEVETITGHHGVDVTIISAASQSGDIIQQAMQATRRKGRVVLVGDVAIDFDRDPFYSKEIDFLISCSYGPGRYDATYENDGSDYPYAYVRWTENRNMMCFVDLLEKGDLKTDLLISGQYSINDANKAYDSLQAGNVLGVVLTYDLKASPNEQKKTLAVQQRSTEVVRVGVVGVGGFAKTKILPLLAAAKNVSIKSIIDADIANATTIAQIYKAESAGNDCKKISADEDIDAVIIATPHGLHASQAIDCLSAGKAVLVEKPAAVSFEQFAQLKQVANYSNVPFCVDFNRSCSPFMQKIKQVVVTRINPMIITYRMNAGYLPKTHWIQSSTNRGRIVGEACHIFELFCFLTDAQPLAVSVSSLHPLTDDHLLTDNVVAVLHMSDGSTCSLTYTSLGHSAVSKEYMEIFFDGKTIVMNDFTDLTGFGIAKKFNEKNCTPDKGHAQLIKDFFKAVQEQGPMPIPLERIFWATEVSLIVDKLARMGGGYEMLSSS